MAAVTWNKVPTLTPNAKALGNSFNARWPNRSGASDGALGDAAHKLSPSGHNPDGTPGSRPEFEDGDGKAETRAIDVTSAGLPMQGVCDAIIATPADRARLSYIIFNKRIAGVHTSWKWQPYSGDNPHTQHGHFSGLPGADENSAPFTSVINYGQDGDDDMSARASGLIEAMGEPSGTKGLKEVPKRLSPFNKIELIFDRLGPVEQTLAEIKNAIGTVPAPGGSGNPGNPTALDVERVLTAATTAQLLAEIGKRAR